MTSLLENIALTLSGWTEVSILTKATLLLALGLAAGLLARRASASSRHLLFASLFAALLALPAIEAAAPRWTIEVVVDRTGEPTALTVAPSPPTGAQPASRSAGSVGPVNGPAPGVSWMSLARLAWMGGVFLLFSSLAFDLWRLRRIRRDALPRPDLRSLTASLAAKQGIHRQVEVLMSEDIPAPLTCGMWNPAILLPFDSREWSDADLRRALVHELEHVRRGDWAVQLASRVTCIFYWPHPLAWMAWRRLCLEAERACDDAVVQRADHAEYAEQLVALAQRFKLGTRPALGMANRSDLATRVSALLDARQPRNRTDLLAAAGVLGVASLVVLAIAPLTAVAQFRTPTAEATRATVSRLDRALIEAAEEGDIAGMEQMLRAGANVNSALQGDGSPLIAAARKGSVPAVQMLLDRGADPNMAVLGDGNPLIEAAGAGKVEIVALLLDRGASIDQVVPQDENALITASAKGRLEVVRLLVSRRADINARVQAEAAPDRPNGEWRTPLSMARRGKHEAVVNYLMSVGARD